MVALLQVSLNYGCLLYSIILLKDAHSVFYGQGLVPLHFSSKDFEILDLDPPNNPTSHYGACHFGYNLALTNNDTIHDKQLILKTKQEYFGYLPSQFQYLSELPE